MQTKTAFEAAVEALKDAGVKIVEIDMSLLESLADELTPGMMFFTYEMPREISRYAEFTSTKPMFMAELNQQLASII